MPFLSHWRKSFGTDTNRHHKVKLWLIAKQIKRALVKRQRAGVHLEQTRGYLRNATYSPSTGPYTYCTTFLSWTEDSPRNVFLASSGHRENVKITQNHCFNCMKKNLQMSKISYFLWLEMHVGSENGLVVWVLEQLPCVVRALVFKLSHCSQFLKVLLFGHSGLSRDFLCVDQKKREPPLFFYQTKHSSRRSHAASYSLRNYKCRGRVSQSRAE